ncbi:hypothetical protein ES708_29194 [subsurface metagenome]
MGATRGGNEFNLNREIRDIEVDGVRGSVKGLRRRTVCRPQITCNLIELSLDNLIKAIAGANQAASAEQIVVEEEYPGDGDGTKVLFELAKGNIVENTERVFVSAVEKTRSKKYDSRFIGANAIDNKEFETGTGDWAKATGNTGTLSHVAGGLKGDCMKYLGGTTDIALVLTLDGENGVVLTNLVKDQHYRLQFAMKKGATYVSGAGITPACTSAPVLVAAPIVPEAEWTVYVYEFVATGADATLTLTSDGALTADDEIFFDFFELEEVDGDYVMNWYEGEVIFDEDAPPANEAPVTVRYTYTTANVYHDVITGGDIEDEDYIDNVALVGTISGKAKDVICIVKNALADTGFSISTAPRDEAVPVIVFTGHYAAGDPDTEPWEVRYPRE